ncbi:hypothetical protein RND81_09G066100 [Saponaria officinalis]|uniref:Uncharacterized protein n=1 Tax=Saponaria officinalis TaxID=3572 RepID=A0AAW1IJI6_SAPOF
MTLSDDVAFLKIKIHKLAIAIEELAMRRYVHGEIDISKLPWFTPRYVPGDSIKLSGSCLPTVTAYNGNITNSALSDSKVFAEYPKSKSCLEYVQMPGPNNNEQDTPLYKNGKITGCLDVPEPQTANYNTKTGQEPHAQKMFDELSLPTYIIKEMAETAKTIELDPIQGDDEPASAVQRVQGDHFTHKQQLFAKLGTLEVSHFRDLVIIYANKVRFSAIPGSLYNGRQLSDKMPHEVDVPYGNSYSKCLCSQVSVEFSIILNADHTFKFIENMVSPLLSSDID